MRWRDARQILTHYYTGVHFRDASGALLTPPDRWNALSITPTAPLTLTAGLDYSFTLTVQNTGVAIWTVDGSFALGYRWRRVGDQGVEGEKGAEAIPIPQDVSPGQTITLTVPVRPPAGATGAYTLIWDMRHGTNWFSRQSPSWPTQDMSAWITPLLTDVYAYPDPFSPNDDGWQEQTFLHYTLGQEASVQVLIPSPHPCYYPRTLWSGSQPAGEHSVAWDGCLQQVPGIPCPLQVTSASCPLGWQVPWDGPYEYKVQTTAPAVEEVTGTVTIDCSLLPPFSGLVVAANDDHVYRTRDILAAAPIWENISPPWTGHRHLLLDPHDPGTAWLVGRGELPTDTLVARSQNITAANPASVTWTPLLTRAAIESADAVGAPIEGVFLVERSRLDPDLVYILVAESEDWTWLAHSHDGGANWEWVSVEENILAQPPHEMEHGGSLVASAHDVNRVWFATRGMRLWRSVDGGHSVIPVYEGNDTWLPVVAWRPLDNAGDQTGVGSVERVIQYTGDGGASWTAATGITPGYHCQNPGTILFPSSESDLVYAFTTASDNDEYPHTLFRSDDGGLTYVGVGQTPTSMRTPGVLAANPDLIVIQRRTASYPELCSGHVFYLSQDGGRTWQDKTGNREGVFGCYPGHPCRGIWPAPEP